MAARSNLAVGELAKIEHGEGEFTILTLLAIAEQLRTTVHDLLKGIA